LDVENWRAGFAGRLGLGPDELRSSQPALVYCSLSGFGADRSRAGYDQVVQGTSGWMSVTGTPESGPTKSGVPIGDIAAGMFGAQMALAALFRRQRTGEGAFVDIAMHDSLVAMLTYQAGRYFATSVPPSANGNSHPSLAPYGTFDAADGPVNIAVGNTRQWQGLCQALGLFAAESGERFVSNAARLTNRAEIDHIIANAVRAMTRSELLARLGEAGVPAGPINDLQQVFTDPVTIERGLVLESRHPRLGVIRSAGSPWQLDRMRTVGRLPPPDLGEHTDEVIRELLQHPSALARPRGQQ
jgi:crotonobetainyl-CoA:carnitine CoA-transferase CaiB-like acyl-CoA transferase